jgi:hypothetical protein
VLFAVLVWCTGFGCFTTHCRAAIPNPTLLLLLLLLPAGLLRLVGSEDELAAVLAHEVSIVERQE